MRIVFFGTPTFASELLNAILDNGFEVVGIVTKPDKPQGRSQKLLYSAVKETALARLPLVPLYQPEIVSSPEFAPTLAALNADLFLVIAYGEILKQHLLEMPRLACINVHGSLLPKYRGAAPIQRAILDGETESGATIMHMVKKMDAGDMIRIVKVPIGPDTTFGELHDLICEASVQPLLDVLSEYRAGKIPQSIPQDPALVTFAPKIELEDCEIDWNRPARELHNLIRGVNPEPGAWCSVSFKGETKKMKIFRSAYVDSPSAIPGTLLEFKKNKMIIACGTGALQLLDLQLEGKKRMNAGDFINGVVSTDLTFNSDMA